MSDVLVDLPSPKVALLTLNRPKARNALNSAVREELAAQVTRLVADPEIHVIVLTGGDIFAAGADLRDMVEKGAAEMLLRGSQAFWQTLTDCPKPIIAAVNGYAWGGGCELAMHADIIIAGETASFAQPEIKVGIMPGAGGTQRLTRAIGKYKALRYLLTGDPLSARDAAAAGLVSEVVADAEVLPTALALATKIAKMPQIAVRQIKEVLLAGQDVPLSTALTVERKAFQLLFDTHDQKEGMRAFLEKRPAQFEGR